MFGVVQRGKPGVHVEQDFKRYLFSTGHAVLSDDYKSCLLNKNDSIKMLETEPITVSDQWIKLTEFISSAICTFSLKLRQSWVSPSFPLFGRWIRMTFGRPKWEKCKKCTF